MITSGKLHEWQVFVTIAKLGSLSAASKHLGVSVSTVSKQLSRLEEGVNAILINRDTHNLQLTDSGRLAYEKIELVLGLMDELVTNLRNPSREIHGSVRLTAPALVCEFLANNWVAEYMEMHPDVSVFLESRESTQFSKESSAFDHLVIKSGVIASDDLVHRKLLPLHLSLCATREYIEINGDISHPSNLHDHPFLWVHHHELTASLTFNKGDEEYIFNKSSGHRFSSDSLLSTFNLMSVGKGICIATPGFLAQASERHINVVTILDDWDIQEIPVNLIWRQRKYYSPLFLDFTKFISEKWNNRPLLGKLKT